MIWRNAKRQLHLISGGSCGLPSSPPISSIRSRRETSRSISPPTGSRHASFRRIGISTAALLPGCDCRFRKKLTFRSGAKFRLATDHRKGNTALASASNFLRKSEHWLSLPAARSQVRRQLQPPKTVPPERACRDSRRNRGPLRPGFEVSNDLQQW